MLLFSQYGSVCGTFHMHQQGIPVYGHLKISQAVIWTGWGTPPSKKVNLLKESQKKHDMKLKPREAFQNKEKHLPIKTKQNQHIKGNAGGMCSLGTPENQESHRPTGKQFMSFSHMEKNIAWGIKLSMMPRISLFSNHSLKKQKKSKQLKLGLVTLEETGSSAHSEVSQIWTTFCFA